MIKVASKLHNSLSLLMSSKTLYYDEALCGYGHGILAHKNIEDATLYLSYSIYP
jgi:hypothetical protein